MQREVVVIETTARHFAARLAATAQASGYWNSSFFECFKFGATSRICQSFKTEMPWTIFDEIGAFQRWVVFFAIGFATTLRNFVEIGRVAAPMSKLLSKAV